MVRSIGRKRQPSSQVKSSLIKPPMRKSLLVSNRWLSDRVPLRPCPFDQWAGSPIWLWPTRSSMKSTAKRVRKRSNACGSPKTGCLRTSSYYNARKKPMGRGTRAWRDVIDLNSKGTSDGRCDQDILLGSFFRLFPRPRCMLYWFPIRKVGSDPVDLLEALQVPDSTWRLCGEAI